MRYRTGAIVCIVLILLGGASSSADDGPSNSLTVGQAVEVAGKWDAEGFFVAKHIELLPRPRRPKLRGPIEALDSAAQRIRVFGRWIHITSRTQFVNTGESALSFATLKPKQRVEVSCKVDSLGQWIARSARVGKVKKSDKVKGTLTATACDDRSPDTLEISGLMILMTDKTEVFRTLGSGPDKAATRKETKDSTDSSR